MASRKEQKEQLRREREEREAAAKAAERRRRLVGYGAAAALVAAVAVVAVVLLLSGGDGGGSDTAGGGKAESGDVLPDDGSVPGPKIEDLQEAVQAADCELKSFKGGGGGHTRDLGEKIDYDSNPPTHGRHFEIPADDQAYEEAPDAKELVHSLEHGRIVVWFKQDLPAEQRANLKALYDEDPFQMLLAPNETGMTYAVAASAWNRDPPPGGTGRLLGCPEYNEQIFDAVRMFKDEHRSNGPEPVP